MHKNGKYTLHVKPGSRKGPLIEMNDDDSLTVYVRERAVDGKANEALVELLASHFGVAKTTIRIVHGIGGRHKVIEL